MNDVLNGLFEFGGAILLLMHCRRLYQDKQIRGFSPWPMVFYMLWGFFNLYFYPSVGCWWSFAGGIGVVGVNTAYCAMLWRYRKN